jgi:hypothetical protein
VTLELTEFEEDLFLLRNSPSLHEGIAGEMGGYRQLSVMPCPGGWHVV